MDHSRDRMCNRLSNKMTREEVKEQLAKNPLEWKEDTRGHLFSEVFPLGRDVRIIFVLIEGDILIKVDYGGGRSVGEFLGFDSDDEELKEFAEDHRLDLACRMLGVTD